MSEARSENERTEWPFVCPTARSWTPPSGGVRCVRGRRPGDLTAPDTVDRMSTATAASAEQLVALLEPVTVAVDREALRVLIEDRGEQVGYELWFRPGRGRGNQG